MRNFTYLVANVDAAARCMEVVYLADGYEPVLVGVRAPVQGEDPAALIAQFAPTGVWDAIDIEKLPLAMPEVGTGGRIEAPMVVPAPPVEPPPEIILRRVPL